MRLSGRPPVAEADRLKQAPAGYKPAQGAVRRKQRTHFPSKAVHYPRNERCIKNQVKQRYGILDIGLDPIRRARSKFYALEKRVLEELG